MDVVELSRFQFASTSIFHFFFVSLTVGLAFLIAVMETFAFVRSDRRELYGKMTNFFGHLFLINFAAVGTVFSATSGHTAAQVDRKSVV